MCSVRGLTTLAEEVDQLVTGTSCDDWRRREPHVKTSGLITPRARKERKQEQKQEQEKNENKNKAKARTRQNKSKNNKTQTERKQTRARRKEPHATTQVDM